MTRVLHTARISNVSHINLVNGQAHNESLVAQLVRAPNRYLGGHGFDSRQGLRIFLCPMLVSLLKKIIFKYCFVSRLPKDKNDKELANLPLSCPFSSAAQASPSVPANTTREGIVSLFAFASALIGGNFLLSQNIARMFTSKQF